MMMSIAFIAIIYFIIGIFAREIFRTVLKELDDVKEGIKKANDLAESQAER
ncbi:hypothetical protein [Alkalibacterium gilvum]|uniref:hypothetical protein n=1 Tax=Alkalibacterium gilvum TaxID=1130080 RepID=UPI003F924AF8